MEPPFNLQFSKDDIAGLINDVLGSRSTPTPSSTENGVTVSGAESTRNLHRESITPNGTPAPSMATEIPAPRATPPEVQIPMYVMFGHEPGKHTELMNQSSLEKLPQMALARLVSYGNFTGTILMSDNYGDYQSMLRLKDFLENGTYRPFQPKSALEYIDANGATQLWTAGKDSKSVVHVTDGTKELFKAEIQLYLFSIRIGYEALRLKSIENICYNYPLSVEGIWELVTLIYRIAKEVGDVKFADFILEALEKNSKELTELQVYLRELRQHVKCDSDLGKALFESYIFASESARRKVVELSKRDSSKPTIVRKESINTKAAPSPTIKQEHPSTATSSPLSVSATNPLDPASRGLTPHTLRFADLDRMARTIFDGNLAITTDDGYGTLVHPDLPSRNRDFKFHRGELLMVNDMESTVNGRFNIMVYNSRGQRGDILRKLIRPVPVNLGVEGVTDVWAPGPAKDVRSSAPDREQRLSVGGQSSPPQARNQGYHRPRSRSPPPASLRF